MSRINKNFMLSEKNLKYIMEIKEEREEKYISDALEIIINEHRQSGDRSVDYLVKIIADRIIEELKNELSKVKKIGNHTDKNVLVMIEMLNGMFFKEDYKKIVTTSEEQCPALQIAISEINKRIEAGRTKNLDNQV